MFKKRSCIRGKPRWRCSQFIFTKLTKICWVVFKKKICKQYKFWILFVNNFDILILRKHYYYLFRYICNSLQQNILPTYIILKNLEFENKYLINLRSLYFPKLTGWSRSYLQKQNTTHFMVDRIYLHQLIHGRIIN